MFYPNRASFVRSTILFVYEIKLWSVRLLDEIVVNIVIFVSQFAADRLRRCFLPFTEFCILEFVDVLISCYLIWKRVILYIYRVWWFHQYFEAVERLFLFVHDFQICILVRREEVFFIELWSPLRSQPWPLMCAFFSDSINSSRIISLCIEKYVFISTEMAQTCICSILK